MKFGKFDIVPVTDGKFKLDGGAMFGIVPKVLWNKTNPSDDRNRILLALNCLLIRTNDLTVLVETGIGEKFDEKNRDIYGVDRTNTLDSGLAGMGLSRQDIDAVILTHLHFDHAGGNTVTEPNGEAVSAFPRAKFFIQRGEWEDAVSPSVRSRASYLPENFLPIRPQVHFLEGDTEIFPGISVKVTRGHTANHQIVLLDSEGKRAVFWGDLIPTSSHVKIPYVMGYDLYPLDSIVWKERLLKEAVQDQWLSVWVHDPVRPWGFVREEDGKLCLSEIKEAQSAAG